MVMWLVVRDRVAIVFVKCDVPAVMPNKKRIGEASMGRPERGK